MGAMVPMLLVLVVIHELGHFFTARALGVKVLEFGVGFPPRAFAIYTGRTRVLFDPQTRFVGVEGPGALVSGQFVRISSSEWRAAISLTELSATSRRIASGSALSKTNRYRSAIRY